MYLKENGNKNFSFERDYKTKYRSLLQNFYISLIWRHILIVEIYRCPIVESCPPSRIFVDMTKWDHAILFSYETTINMRQNRTYVFRI